MTSGQGAEKQLSKVRLVVGVCRGQTPITACNLARKLCSWRGGGNKNIQFNDIQHKLFLQPPSQTVCWFSSPFSTGNSLEW